MAFRSTVVVRHSHNSLYVDESDLGNSNLSATPMSLCVLAEPLTGFMQLPVLLAMLDSTHKHSV